MCSSTFAAVLETSRRLPTRKPCRTFSHFFFFLMRQHHNIIYWSVQQWVGKRSKRTLYNSVFGYAHNGLAERHSTKHSMQCYLYSVVLLPPLWWTLFLVPYHLVLVDVVQWNHLGGKMVLLLCVGRKSSGVLCCGLNLYSLYCLLRAEASGFRCIVSSATG